MSEWLELSFVQNAFAASLLAGVLCGIVGTYVVANRIAYLAGGVAHAAYGGVGLAFYLEISPTLGILGFTMAAALLMGVLSLRERHRADTAISVLWAFGMALGVLLVDITPGYGADLMSYLFGSILTVSRGSLAAMAMLTLIVLPWTMLFHNELAAVSYDESFARVRGLPVTAFYLSLVGLMALTVVVLVQVVGLILVIALLTIAPYIAEKRSRSLLSMMGRAVVYNVLFGMTGLCLSLALNVTSGAAIICVAAAGYFLSVGLDNLKKRQGLRGHHV
ncbi:metal ABC transporter permease [Desulfosoma caldarium]|uniref:Zinc transport system permease protein n=1 Tax=Desulfosoma caldarium TaxID=610254 RepID=A0A3N1UPN2_9BACT|nr:metal ABC transporter permease [Desulfosoma caldarium]ROQ90700.1 zinc transport system permease protein [Desulfosoma caldarium]